MDTHANQPSEHQGAAVDVSSGPLFCVFEQRQIREAYQFAADGNQALHLMDGRFAYLRDDTPICFKNRRQLAHLFDQNKDRLIRTARRFGVRVIRVEREGTHQQHIDLCGKPLDRALELAKQIAWEQSHSLLPQNVRG